jgi:ABC-type polysaccharide/polyol phosphate export permease
MISIGPSVMKNNVAPMKKKNKKKSILPLERTATPMITIIVGKNIIWIWMKLSECNNWTQERPAEGGKEEDVYATIADSSST